MISNSKTIPSPKQNNDSVKGRQKWYPYYAGFSPSFVVSVLKATGCNKNTAVCDPWNGAGTTTQSSFDLGIPCYGFDINPVMTKVAIARTLLPSNISNVRQKHDLVISCAKRMRSRLVKDDDPLAIWFGNSLVLAIRDIEKSVAALKTVRQIRALFDAAMFRSLQQVIGSFRSSNPTWIKQPNEFGRIECSKNQFLELYSSQIQKMISDLDNEGNSENTTRIFPDIRTASSKEIPLPNESIRLVLGSPPYCTRIDYAVSTSVELAYLGIDIHGKDRSFRNSITGTSTVRNQVVDPKDEWGDSCRSFLNAVRSHPSKASKSYYFKMHLQYFDDLYQSLSQIERILQKTGDGFLVVQDSFYKEIHNNLPKVVEEMVTHLNMQVVDRMDHPVLLDMGRVNPRANRKRLKKRPVESVIHFKKRNI